MSAERREASAAGVREDRYVPQLESLRGLAILLVLLFHVQAYTRPVEPANHPFPLALLFAFPVAGATGVSLFFVLSGFLLSRPFLAEARGGPRVDRGVYFGRRALRILPTYYVVVLASAFLAGPWRDALPRAAPYLVFLNAVPGWCRPMPPYSDVFWSLATEVQFYLLLPLLPLALRSRAGRIGGLLALLAYAVWYAAFLAHLLPFRDVIATYAIALSVLGRGWLFLWGIGAAWFYERWRRRGGASHSVSLAADATLLAAFVGLGTLLRWVHSVGDIQNDFPPLHLWHLVEGGLWTTILLLLLCAPLRAERLLHNRVLTWLGVTSYSLYLVHHPIIFGLVAFARLRLGMRMLGANLPSLAGTVVILAIVLGVATLLHVLVERPFLRRKARLAAT